MATKKQVVANRLNAKQSTGPRTKGGKQRVSKNATKRGLAAAAIYQRSSALAEQLFRALFPEQDSVSFDERVREITGLQFVITMARAAKTELLKNASDEPGLGELLDQYRRIDRYERRALSRRKTLLRNMQ